MRGVLTRAWLTRGPIALALWPLSLLMRFLVSVRSLLYRFGALQTVRVDVPVIVVGNVVAGGAGKTPVVIEVVRHLQSRGFVVGVISRGYGRRSSGCAEVTATSTANEVGDEPLLIARSTGAPVFVAEKRADAARRLLLAHPQTRLIVMDDGLQHQALARDIEICIFDARTIGNGLLLPAGPLREPWPRHCDFMLYPVGARLARPADTQAFSLDRQLANEAVNGAGQRVALSQFRGRRVVALAGIAQPRNFFSMLRQAGITPAASIEMPDHATYDQGLPPLAAGHEALLCTEKDAVKLWPTLPEVWAVPLRVNIDGAFWPALDASLSRLNHPKLSSTDGHQTA